jgi:NitT/TauT family transport system permease protein
MKRASVVTWLIVAVFAVAAVTAWQLASAANPKTAFFFSSPSQVILALQRNLQNGQLISDFVASAMATLCGLGLGALAGCVIGLLALLIPAVTSVVRIAVLALAALPILAVAPMFLIWFGAGAGLKIAIATVLCATAFAGQTLTIPSALPPGLRDFLLANRLPLRQQLGKVMLPLGVEHLLKVTPAAANAAFLGVFVGEFVAADRGIGYRILRAGALYQVDVVLAQVLVALALLMALQLIVHAGQRAGTVAAERASLPAILRRKRS